MFDRVITSENCFQLLDLKIIYDLDLEVLRNAYHKLQVRLNQELSQASSSVIQLQYAQKIATVNEAYQLLQNDVLRGYHMLWIKEGKLFDSDGTTFQDPELLEEIMSFHDALEGTNAFEKQRFLDILKHKIKTCYQAVQVSFDDYNLEQILANLRRLSYLKKACHDLDASCRECA